MIPARAESAVTSSVGRVIAPGSADPAAARREITLVGRISMDYTTVDVSAVDEVACGDEVICLGRSGDDAITPDDWAEIKGTHAYDIICSLGARVERKVSR